MQQLAMNVLLVFIPLLQEVVNVYHAPLVIMHQIPILHYVHNVHQVHFLHFKALHHAKIVQKVTFLHLAQHHVICVLQVMRLLLETQVVILLIEV
jgi:hypothetical protein